MIDPCSIAPRPLLTLEAALTELDQAIIPITELETISLAHSLGRVLGSTLTSPIDIPYDRNAAMDGYAFSSLDQHSDNAFELRQVGISWAGKPFDGTLESGQCVRIFTGAKVPDFADSVIMQEQVTVNGMTVRLPDNTPIKQNIRAAGEDVKQDQVLCVAPKQLTPIDMGLLAAAGISTVQVKRRLKIQFFSTGDELIPTSEPPQSGKIYDSNRYLLHGLLHHPCYQVVDGGVLVDDPQYIEEALGKAAESFDVILTTGGASVGDADYVTQTLRRLGAIQFWKIAIKPGKPFAFGKIGRCYFFGLPGNPLAVTVTFKQLVMPALARIMGLAPKQPLRFKAICTNRLKKSPGRLEFQNGILRPDGQGGFVVTSTGHQGSHLMSSQQQANCHIVLPTECNGVQAGEPVEVEPFSTFL